MQPDRSSPMVPNSTTTTSTPSSLSSTIPKPIQERAQQTKSILEEQLVRRREQLQQRTERRQNLQKELLNAPNDIVRQQIIQNYEENERNINRTLRKRYTINDFESLVIIGRGAFGEVSIITF